ncbi:MAG: tetratricopeptide repeat protein [Candidatus Binatia bacterium]
MAPATDGDRRTGQRLLLAALAALLVAAVALVYAQVRHAGFFNFDDPAYIADNPFVRGGLTLEGLRQAFFGSRGALWMPLAFTSHMLDVQLFGLAPAGPHLVNVAIHAANAVLLLWLLVRATGAVAPSVAVAALFALHPMRVESVAWIAERKDVLSAFFGLLTLHAWVSYAREPSRRAYGLVVAGTVLALLSKPMLVTLPVLLLLFDWWPLGRLGTLDADGRRLTVVDLVVEKLPLVVLAAAAVTITLVAAQADGGLMALSGQPLPARFTHAVVSYGWYAWKTVWPADLAVFYPLPAWSGWEVAGATLGLAAAGGMCVATRARAPWIAAGVAWFLIGLLPVIGLLQAGRQGMADRFTYLPAIGLLVAVAWTLDAAVRARAGRAALAGATVLAVVVLAAASHRQVGYWRTSESLFERTLAVTGDNPVVEDALASVLANGGRAAEAYPHFAEALRIQPGDAVAAHGLGIALEGLGRYDEAAERYRDALRLEPSYWRAHNDLGVFLLKKGDVESALHHFSEAVRLNPTAATADSNLRLALERAGIADANADAYVRGLLTWAAAVDADRQIPGGATYGASLSGDLLGSRPEVVRGCFGPQGDGATAPFTLYVEVGADGTLTAVTAVPPTRAARCLREELRAARAPAPPFAPFRAMVSMPAVS